MKFFIKKKAGRSETQIYLRFSLSGVETTFFTGEKIPDFKLWNSKKEQVNKSVDFPFSVEINKRLQMFKLNLDSIISDLEYEKIDVTGIAIKKRFEETKERNKKSAVTFFEAFTKYIEEAKKTKSTETVKTYITTRNQLYMFDKKISFELDEKQLDKFIEYLQTKHVNKTRLNWVTKKTSPPRKITKGVSDSTLQLAKKVLKSFLVWAFDKNYHKNLGITRKIKFSFKNVSNYILSAEEIKAIANATLPAELHDTRNIFLVGSLTGLRFGDIHSLKPTEITLGPNPVISKFTNKTSTEVTIWNCYIYLDIKLS